MAEPGKKRRTRAAKTPVPEGEPAAAPALEEVPVPADGGTNPGTPGTGGEESVVPDGSAAVPVPDGTPTVKEPEPEAVKDPVEILVGLAERGEIDPWNIDIIEVTDRFLSELERCRQLNLQISGRTLFYAATLLRMKSEQLDVASDDEEGDGEGEDYALAEDPDFADESRLGPIERLEREIQRRLDRKNLRKSPVTLFELIIELKNLEKEERRRRRLPPPDEDYLVEADDVVSIAHEEGYQDSSRQIIEECLANADPSTEITLAELCKDLGWKLPEVYLPLLFIALDGRCSIRQEEFFGDVYVHVLKEEGDGEPTDLLTE
jgi:segregation and condensation protein A